MIPDSESTYRYVAAEVPRGFLRHAFPLHRYPLQAWKSRTLVWNFFQREMLGNFRGSIGGMYWVLVQPLFQFVIYFAVFGVVMAGRGSLEGPLFAFYLFSGILMFNAVQGGPSGSLRSVLQNGNLVKKVAFPCELLPLTPVLVAGVTYLIGCVVLLVIGLLAGQVAIGWSFLAWPLVFGCMMGFCIGFGLLLAGVNVFARDVMHLYQVLAQAWFFGSPVFWDVEMIQEKAEGFGVGWVIDLMVLNPAYCLLLAQRQVFGIGWQLTPERYAQTFPLSLGGNLLVSGLWALFMLLVGYGFFMSRKHKFADLV